MQEKEVLSTLDLREDILQSQRETDLFLQKNTSSRLKRQKNFKRFFQDEEQEQTRKNCCDNLKFQCFISVEKSFHIPALYECQNCKQNESKETARHDIICNIG